MHALHRPDLRRAATVTVVAAVLAIVLTLAPTAGPNDVASTPAPTGTAGTPSVVWAPTTSPEWALTPFTPLLPAPVARPWATTQP